MTDVLGLPMPIGLFVAVRAARSAGPSGPAELLAHLDSFGTAAVAWRRRRRRCLPPPCWRHERPGTPLP